MSQTDNPRYRAAELAALLARHYPDAEPRMIARVVFDMQTGARAAKHWDTMRCNLPMTEEQEAAGNARVEELEAKINATLVSGLGMTRPLMRIDPVTETYKVNPPATVELGGDPRGPCGRLHIPGQAGDGWGDGFAIY